MSDRPTVLVAHTDADRSLLCRSSLEHEGYRVLTAATEAQVREQLAEELPHVVLLDVGLAAADGWSLLGSITTTERTRETPVVLLAGEGGEGGHLEGWSAGATEVVVGALGPLVLSRVVRDVLDTSPAERRRRRGLADATRGLLPGAGADEAPPAGC